MKKIILILSISVTLTFASNIEEKLDKMMILIEQNGKKIEQNGKKIEQNGERIEQNAKKIEQNGKKIEQVDAKIEQVDKRLDFMQNIFYIILAGVFGVPLYMNRENNKTRDIIVALRELAQDDPKIERSLKVAGIL